MKGFDVLNVKSAVKARNKFDLSRTHLTTMDFGQIVPLFVEETVPGDEYHVSANFFSRTAPLVKPTFGKFSFKTVNAFVPYHQLAVDAEAWLDGKTSWEGTTPHHRYFTVGSLFGFIINECVDTGATNVTSGNCDFSYVDTAGTTKYVKFSAKGKYWLKVMNALGYALPQGVDQRTTSTWTTQVSATKLSAYPLLAFFKLYNDYMSQSQRFNTSQLSTILNNIKYNITNTSVWSAASGEITRGFMTIAFANLKLNYENDYFISAWQTANSPINAQDNLTSTPNVGSYGSIMANATDNYLSAPVTSTPTASIGQRALNILRSFDDWVRRNNYSGSRAVQQVYSRFGIKTDEYKSHYAHVISTDSQPIQVGDVTATADAQNVPLGDYAGKAIMNGGDGFSVKCDDYGVILVLGYFTVRPMMAFGYDRSVLRSAPHDYFTPEFDGVGVDAISLGEVWESPIVAGTDTTNSNAVYGYTERYNSYKYGRDMITGEFRDYHKDGDMNTWHSGRNLAEIRRLNNMIAQSSSMNTLEPTGSEYNRIFSITDDSVDHFYLTAQFKVDAIRPMKNLNQVVDLGVGDTTVPRNGNVIS